MSNVILFHELNNRIVNKVIEIYNDVDHIHHPLIVNAYFAFDDALYSQYTYLPKLIRNTRIPCKIFVSSEFVYDGDEEQIVDITAPQAHELGRSGDLRAYCTINDLNVLKDLGVSIGNHGASHFDFSDREYNIVEYKNIVEREVTNSLTFFELHGFNPTSFAYPYNNEVPFYKLLLSKHGYSNFFGNERINIETLF